MLVVWLCFSLFTLLISAPTVSINSKASFDIYKYYLLYIRFQKPPADPILIEATEMGLIVERSGLVMESHTTCGIVLFGELSIHSHSHLDY